MESGTTSTMTCVRLWVQQTRKECLTLLPLKPLLSEPRTLKCQVSFHLDGRQEGCLGCASREPRLRVPAATLAGPAGTPSASPGGAGGPHGSTTATPASRLTVKPVCSGTLSFHKLKCWYTDCERQSERVSKWHLGVRLNSKNKEGNSILMSEETQP